MCDRNTNLTDPTADFILSDLLTATEDLIDFAINVLDAIRLQSHFNDRNRRVNLGLQLKDASDAQKSEFGIVELQTKPCIVTTTLKYDLTLYLDRIFQACKRTKANLMLLRVARTRSTNTTLLLVASSNVRVEKLNKKVQLLTRLVKENGGEFQTKKKKKKKDLSKIKLDENVESTAENKQPVKKKQQQQQQQPPLTLMSKDDLGDYVEIALSFRMVIIKYREFIDHVRSASKSNGQASVANSIVLIPIAANAINELNNILNRLVRIAFTVEAEANYLRQSPATVSIPIENKELYRQDKETAPLSQMLLTEQIGLSRVGEDFQSQKEGSNLKRNTYSVLKQNETRSNIRNQSAISSSTSKLLTTTSSSSNVNSFKLTPNIIANIFEDFFINTKDLFD